MTKNTVDINKIILEDYVVPESEFDKKRTKTSHFLLNTVFPNSTIMTTEYFVNAFLDDKLAVHFIEMPLFLLFKAKLNDAKWDAIAQRLRTKSEYLLEYFVGGQGEYNLIMMVFKIPPKYSNEYASFINGKYSKFSQEYKKLFPRYTTNDKAQPAESTVWRVIHKSPELKKELERYFNLSSTSKIGEPVVFNEEDELWGIPESEFEVYRYKKETNE